MTSRSNPAATLLFWAMILVGGASLAASLWLPAWLELRQAQASERVRLELRDSLREHVTALDLRREHLENDPAYIDRLARREFGEDAAQRESITVEVIPPSPSAQPASQPTEPTWALALEQLAQTHPVVRMYIDPATRWKIQVLSVVLVLAAILFLARRPTGEEAGSAAADVPADPPDTEPAHSR